MWGGNLRCFQNFDKSWQNIFHQSIISNLIVPIRYLKFTQKFNFLLSIVKNPSLTILCISFNFCKLEKKNLRDKLTGLVKSMVSNRLKAGFFGFFWGAKAGAAPAGGGKGGGAGTGGALEAGGGGGAVGAFEAGGGGGGGAGTFLLGGGTATEEALRSTLVDVAETRKPKFTVRRISSGLKSQR